MSNCCSGTSGIVQTPDPAKRVNYTFGLVLGVDEFIQEQTYFLEKHRRHDRLLHGYGTVAGLAVTPDTSTGATQIRISPGAAVTPVGHEMCVPSAMCCTIETWLSQSAADLTAIFGSGPFPLTLDVCVVLCYRECPADAVPVPGEPCRTQDSSMAASRIADSFELKLCLNATTEGWKNLAAGSPPVTIPKNASICLYRPSQVEEFAARLFGRLLDRIQITSEGTTFLTAQDFQNLLLAIPDQAIKLDATAALLATPPAVSPADPPLYIKPAEAKAILTTGLETWVTQIRPTLLNPVAGAPCDAPAEKCVLLADLSVPVNSAFGLAGAVAVDQSRRPWLLDTRLLQEMLLSGVHQNDSREIRTFVTAWVGLANTIRLWIHHPAPLLIPQAAVTLARMDDLSLPLAFSISAVPSHVNVFDLALTTSVAPAEGYRIAFDCDQIMEANSPPAKLSDRLNDPQFNYLDRVAQLIYGYTEHAYDSIKPGDAATNDLGGTYPGPTVVGLQGHPIATTAPVPNQVLTWDGSFWQPQNPAPPTFPPATNDLSGTYPAITVTGLQGRGILPLAPSPNQVLTFVGSNWQPANPPPPVFPAATNDVSGTYPALIVVGLQGRAVVATAPQIHQALGFDGARWAPADYVQAPFGPYAIVAAGVFRNVNAVMSPQGPAYGNLKVTNAGGGLLRLTFDDYKQPTTKFTYVVKITPIADRQEALPQSVFVTFTNTDLVIRVVNLDTGVMLEISRIGEKG